MSRSAWKQVQRDLYLVQRTMGDIAALQRGTLFKRLIRRKTTRSIWGPAMNALFRKW